MEFNCTAHYRRDDWDARVETTTHTTCDKTHFYFSGSLEAFSKGELVVSRKFNQKIERDCM